MLNIFYKFITYLFYLPFSLLFFIIIRLISPLIKIRFAMVNSHRIGHFALEWETFHQLNHQRKFNVFLIAFHKTISNEFFAKIIKRKIIIFPSKFIRLIQILNNSFFGNSYHEYIFHNLTNGKDNDTHNLFSKNKPFISFTKEEISKGNQILKHYKTKKIVCLLVRDGEYLKNTINKKSDFNNIRNSKIEDFITGIKYLEKKGYTIFRMGKHVEKRLSYTSSNVIDYPFSNIRSDFMDLFLIKECKFFITTGTGLDAVAYALNKPLLFINYSPMLSMYILSNNYLWTFKKIYSFKKKKYLTFSEMVKNNLVGLKIKNNKSFNLNNLDIYKKYKLKFVDMNNLEIKNAILDMEKFNFNKNFKFTKYQKKFNKKFLQIFNKKEIPFVFKRGHIAPIVSDSFLRKNKQFLS